LVVFHGLQGLHRGICTCGLRLSLPRFQPWENRAWWWSRFKEPPQILRITRPLVVSHFTLLPGIHNPTTCVMDHSWTSLRASPTAPRTRPSRSAMYCCKIRIKPGSRVSRVCREKGHIGFLSLFPQSPVICLVTRKLNTPVALLDYRWPTTATPWIVVGH